MDTGILPHCEEADGSTMRRFNTKDSASGWWGARAALAEGIGFSHS